MKIEKFSVLFVLMGFLMISCDKDTDVWGEYKGTAHFAGYLLDPNGNIIVENRYENMPEYGFGKASASIVLKRDNNSSLIMQCTSIRTFSEVLSYQIEKNKVICSSEDGELTIENGELSYNGSYISYEPSWGGGTVAIKIVVQITASYSDRKIR
jgi:hypothetical protein